MLDLSHCDFVALRTVVLDSSKSAEVVYEGDVVWVVSNGEAACKAGNEE